jgi:hypothetical protein
VPFQSPDPSRLSNLRHNARPFLIFQGNLCEAALANPASFMVIAAVLRHGILVTVPQSKHLGWLRSSALEGAMLGLFFLLGFLHYFLNTSG